MALSGKTENGIPYPKEGDVNEGAADLQEMAEAVDVEISKKGSVHPESRLTLTNGWEAGYTWTPYPSVSKSGSIATVNFSVKNLSSTNSTIAILPYAPSRTIAITGTAVVGATITAFHLTLTANGAITPVAQVSAGSVVSVSASYSVED